MNKVQKSNHRLATLYLDLVCRSPALYIAFFTILFYKRSDGKAKQHTDCYACADDAGRGYPDTFRVYRLYYASSVPFDEKLRVIAEFCHGIVSLFC